MNAKTAGLCMFFVLSASCQRAEKATATPIALIVADPGRYADSLVTIRGIANREMNSPYIRYKVYSVSDSTGTINVVADSAVFSGTTVEVVGRLRRPGIGDFFYLDPLVFEERRVRLAQ